MSEPHEPMSGEGGGGLRISSWAINNPIPVVVLFIAAILAGWIAYGTLPIKNFPNISFPLVAVEITRSGAAPAEMETQITRPIENAMSGLQNVESIASTITQGVSITDVQFQLGTDLQKATDDVRSKVDQTRNVLPRDVDPPVTQRIEVDDQPIITYAVVAPALSTVDVSWFIDNTIARTLQAEEGVSQIFRTGGLDREINVLVDPVRLAANGVTASQVNDTLALVNVDAPGGRVAIGGREQTLRVLGAALNVDQIRNLSISTGGGRFVRLGDVADVGDGAAEERSFAELDGRPVVGFQVSKSKNASEVSTETNVDKAIKKIEAANPGVHINKIVSRVDQTRASFSATEETLIEGMLLAALVVWLFLRDWRATAVTAIAMPASLIPTFAFMALAGFSLNVVTLLGLTLVIGILVDDAIVEIENIEKRVFMGMRPFQAAMEGADQIGLAVVATTFSIVAVFLPVGFMPGIPGQFFREFGITVAVAVLFSLVVARLLTPLMAAYFLKPKEGRPRPPLPRYYTRPLTWALDHKWISLGIGTLIFFLSMSLAIPLKKGVQPEGNPNYFYVNIEGPPGATVADMHLLVEKVDALLDRQPETLHTFAAVGGGGASGGPGGGLSSSAGVNRGAVVAILKPDRKAKIAVIRDRIRPLLRSIPDARVTFDASGFGAAEVQVILTNESGVGLDDAALQLQRQMRGVPGLADPRPATPPNGRGSLCVREPAREATGRAGAGGAGTGGRSDRRTARARAAGRRNPETVRSGPASRRQRGGKAMTGANAIETAGLSKLYGRSHAVRNLNLAVKPGRITAFLGLNGAGKSTTIRMLLGMIKPSEGSGKVLGRRIDDPAESVALRKDVAYVSEDKRLYNYMTVGQTIRFTSGFFPGWSHNVADALLRRYELPAGRKVRHLSKGMRTKLALLLAVARRPALLMLDEPSEGLDPRGVEQLLEALVAQCAEGTTVFFSSHQIEEVERIADQVCIIHRGRLAMNAPLDELRESWRRVDAVLLRAMNQLTGTSAANGFPGVYSAGAEGGTLFIKPKQMQNSTGSWISIGPALDTKVTLPLGTRTLRDTLGLIYASVAKNGGGKVVQGTGPLNPLFGTRLSITAENEPARSVINRVFAIVAPPSDPAANSALSYQLLCGDPAVDYCALNFQVAGSSLPSRF